MTFHTQIPFSTIPIKEQYRMQITPVYAFSLARKNKAKLWLWLVKTFEQLPCSLRHGIYVCTSHKNKNWATVYA